MPAVPSTESFEASTARAADEQSSSAAAPEPPAGGRLGKLFSRGDAKPAAAPADPLSELRAENETLRVVAANAGFARLVKELHRSAGGENGPSTTALLERSAGGASWMIRASAGGEMSNAAFRTLPDPLKPPKRAEPLPSPAPSLAGAWAVPVAGGGRTGLWIAPQPPTGDDEGRGRRLWEMVGDVLWRRFVTDQALSAARGALALRDAQVALYAAALKDGEPQVVLTRLLQALAAACEADRTVLHTTGKSGLRIAAAGAELSGPVAAVAAEQDAKLAAAVPGTLASGEGDDSLSEHNVLTEHNVATFDRAALAAVGVKSLVGRAAGAMIGGASNGAALLVLKADAGPLPPHAAPTLAWAAGFFADVLPRCTRAAAASRLAKKDGLTGLANRRAFDEQLAALSAAAVATGGDLALLMCDLDHFKSVNDTHGHAVGDRVLKEAAAAIREALAGCRSDDAAVAARYGGEELVVLLPNFGPAGARRMAERIRESIAQIALPSGGPRTHVSTSVGFAVAPFDAADGQDLLHAADAALYAAKTGGRNRVMRASTGDAAVQSADVSSVPR